MTTFEDSTSSLDGSIAARAIPLSAVQPGRLATVVDRLMSEDDAELLNAMGLVDGASVRVCRGGPRCIIQVSATRLALAPDVACRVLVLPWVESPDRMDGRE